MIDGGATPGDTSTGLTPAEQRRLELLEEKRRRLLARDHLEEFCRYIAERLGLPCVPVEHHRLMIARIEALERGSLRRHIGAWPPGSAKSTYHSIVGLSWVLGRHPDWELGLACHTDALALSFSKRVRAIVDTPEFRGIFPECELAGDVAAAELWGTTAGGSFTAIGIGAAIVGRRLDWLHVDDPVRGAQDALSTAISDSHWQWWLNDARTRLKPHGRASIVTTRWSVRDLAGRLLEDQATGGETWDALIVPMECTDFHHDPLHRDVGERLWPQWFQQEMVDQAKRDPVSWQALYQQQPLDAAGSFIELAWLQVVDDPPRDPQYYVGVDLALTSGGDYSAIVVGVPDKATGCLYVVDAWRARVPAGEALDVLVSRCVHYRPLEVVIDDDNAWKLIRSSIGRTFHDARVSPPSFKPMPLHGGPRGTRGEGKQIRAAALQAACSRGEVRILRRAWTADLIDELVRFPGGTHDDWLDCLSLLARRLALFTRSEERADLVEYTLSGTGRTVTLPRLGLATSPSRESPGIDRRPEESEVEYLQRKRSETLDRMLHAHNAYRDPVSGRVYVQIEPIDENDYPRRSPRI